MHITSGANALAPALRDAQLHERDVAAKQHAPPGSALYVVHVSSAGEDGASTLFVEMLKRRRKALGLRQEDLAEAAKVHRATVIRWESGEVVPDPPQIATLARVLRVDPLDVFRALGWLPLEVDATPLPDLPAQVERFIAHFIQASPADAAELLERLDWINEWYESRMVAREVQARGRRIG